MNLFQPVSSIMTTDLKVVQKGDSISEVAHLFNNHKIHHIPVVYRRELVGIISKSDYDLFRHKNIDGHDDTKIEDIRMEKYLVDEIMTTGIAKLAPTDKIRVAIEIFRENIFHSIPIVDQDVLVGIVTTYDIIEQLAVDNEAHSSYAEQH